MIDQTHIHYCDWPTASTCWTISFCPDNPKPRISHGQSKAEFLKGMEMNRGAASHRGRWTGLIVATGLSYVCYRALVARSGGDGRLLLVQAAILATLVIVYAYRCVRILGVRHPGSGTGARFVGLSLLFMAALLLSFASIYRETGLVPPASSPSAREAPPAGRRRVPVFRGRDLDDGRLRRLRTDPAARPYAALEALLGYLFMAFFIPTLIHAMAGPASVEAPERSEPGDPPR